MKLAIVGSMAFAEKMNSVAEFFRDKGVAVFVPEGIEDFLEDTIWKKRAMEWGGVEGAERKIKGNLIKRYYDKIAESDAILVVNQEKQSIKGYIGGNGFLEMGFAHVLGKPIYVLNPLPKELKIFHQELLAMRPIVINGDLGKVEIKN
jgi:hypothetical protein